FAGAARDGVLHAVAGEDFDATIVKLDRDVDRDLAGRALEHLADAVVKPQAGGGLVETDRGGSPGISFLVQMWRRGGGKHNEPPQAVARLAQTRLLNTPSWRIHS